MKVEESFVKQKLEKGEYYFDEEGSTGESYQKRSVVQGNANIYLTRELNKNINQLKESINLHRAEIKKYEEANARSTKWIIFLTIIMAILAFIQALPFLSLILSQIVKLIVL